MTIVSSVEDSIWSKARYIYDASRVTRVTSYSLAGGEPVDTGQPHRSCHWRGLRSSLPAHRRLIFHAYNVEVRHLNRIAMTSIMVPRMRRTRRKVCFVSPVHPFLYNNPSYLRWHAGFTSSAGWTYTLIAALGIVGFYKFAPSPGEDNYVTRYISYYFTPSSSWAATNDRHLELTANLQEAVQISQTGQRPHIHRYRYPQCVCILSFSLFQHAQCRW